ncbi:MAG: hypothetical protein M3Y37_06930 [Chloroflexota bacterium]|jgi:hypothetical protein|nr:hypothetical protein [Chloroflexota bacterium]
MNRSRRLPVTTLEPVDDGSKSQLPTIILLNMYAAAAALFVSRAALKAFEISERYWVGRQIFSATDPFARVLELLPGATNRYVGQMTLGDLTLVIGVILFPLGILGFAGRRR